MKLSPQQQIAKDAVEQWFWNRTATQQVFRLFGYAGTGKTSIAKMLAEELGGNPIFAAYTGKAAHVLHQKGCLGARTIHSLIYIPASKSAQRLRDLQREHLELKNAEGPAGELKRLEDRIRIERENVQRPSFSLNLDTELRDATLLIIDEVSMINAEMGEDLESFKVPILVLGDPAQLPPVKGGGHFTNHEPDVLLTEIHRQAEGSPILKLATQVRMCRNVADSELVVPKGQTIEFMSNFDQILCGTNRTRGIINKKIREFRGFPSNIPATGDRLICTRNDKETGLLNGSQWYVTACWEDDDELRMSIESVEDDRITMSITAHIEPFRGEEVPWFQMRERQCFDFAYAMTVHKSQGSQFEDVCLIDESGKFPSHQRSAWLYTGITRASKNLTVIK